MSDQQPLRFRVAKWIMDRRGAVGIGFILVTIAFALGLPRVEIRTIFKDMLPKDDPFVQVYYDHPNFGNPLTMAIMIKRKNGDIYNPETLAKVWKLTRDIDLAPGVVTTRSFRLRPKSCASPKPRPTVSTCVRSWTTRCRRRPSRCMTSAVVSSNLRTRATSMCPAMNHPR